MTTHHLTRLQHARAYALAAAHGHGWATMEGQTEASMWVDHQGDPEAIRETFKLSPHGHSAVGRGGLLVSADGDVFYETADGRLRWVVFGCGAVDLRYIRPGQTYPANNGVTIVIPERDSIIVLINPMGMAEYTQRDLDGTQLHEHAAIAKYLVAIEQADFALASQEVAA